MGFKEVVETVKNEASDAVEITKLRAKISKEKTAIKSNYVKIGELIYEQQKDMPGDGELGELVKAITESKEKIDGLNADIQKVKEA